MARIITTDHMADTICCPLCDGSGKRSNGTNCPECKGAGHVENHFKLAGPCAIETAEETAAAECRPVEEVREENRLAAEWIARRNQGE